LQFSAYTWIKSDACVHKYLMIVPLYHTKW